MRSASLGLQPASYEDTARRPATGPVPAGYAAALTLAAMSLGYGVVQLDMTIVNTALHSIGTSLGGGVAELQWVVSAYTIAFAAFILTAGAIGDRIGAKRIFMAGFAIFSAGPPLRLRRAGCVRTHSDCRALRSGPGCRHPGAEFTGAAQPYIQ